MVNTVSGYSPYAQYAPSTSSSPYGESIFDNTNLLNQPIGMPGVPAVHHEKKPGFLSKLGAMATGVLNAPGKLAQGIGDLLTFKHPLKSLMTIGSAAACLIPSPIQPLAIAATTAYGGFEVAKGLGKSVAGGVQAWSAGDLNGISEATSGAVVSAGTGALAAYGVRANIKANIETNGVGNFASKADIKRAELDPKTASLDDIKGISEIKVGNKTITSADDVGYWQAVRMSVARSQRAAVREFKGGEYWQSVKGESIGTKASTFKDMTQANISAMRAELSLQQTIKNDPECRAINNQNAALRKELEGADATRTAEIETRLAINEGLLVARQDALKAEQAAAQQASAQQNNTQTNTQSAQAQSGVPKQQLQAQTALKNPKGLTEKELKELAELRNKSGLDRQDIRDWAEGKMTTEAQAKFDALDDAERTSLVKLESNNRLDNAEFNDLMRLKNRNDRDADDDFEMDFLQMKAGPDQGRLRTTISTSGDVIKNFNTQNPGVIPATSPFILPGDKQPQAAEMMAQPEMV